MPAREPERKGKNRRVQRTRPQSAFAAARAEDGNAEQGVVGEPRRKENAKERKKHMKYWKHNHRFLAVLSVLAMVLMFLPVPAMAADAYSCVEDSATGLTIMVSTGIEKLQIAANTDSSVDADYAISSTVAGYFPQSFSLLFNSGTGVTVTPDDSEAYFAFDDQENGYGAVSLGAGSCILTVTKNTTSCTVYCPAPEGGGSSGSGIIAYLPAPAQFTNEGVTAGGWGDAFTSGNDGSVKALVNGYSSTGVSLGSFGGYVVLDYGVPAKDSSGNVISGIYNDPSNAYGVDFILYGNAMNSWAEPGCVQVSLNGEDWYDIAGSLHYNEPAYTTSTDSNGNTVFSVTSAGSVWNDSATYTNPNPSDDAIATAASNLGTYPSNTAYTFSSQVRPGGTALTGSGTVTYNTWHRHSWFPLNCNYFTDRTTDNTPVDLRGSALANLSLCGAFGTEYTGYNASSGTAAAVTFRGVKLMPVTNSSNIGSTAPDSFLFGYADSHVNGSYSASQSNPYTAGRTSGGDPIDIAWAVDGSGNPVSLSAIRYVRVYTGVQQMNGMMGESSTEITGSYRAADRGSGAATDTPTVTFGRTTSSMNTVATANMDTESVSFHKGTTCYVNVISEADHIYVNGISTVSGTNTSFTVESGTTQYVQIITQSGSESPYVTLLKIN